MPTSLHMSIPRGKEETSAKPPMDDSKIITFFSNCCRQAFTSYLILPWKLNEGINTSIDTWDGRERGYKWTWIIYLRLTYVVNDRILGDFQFHERAPGKQSVSSCNNGTHRMKNVFHHCRGANWLVLGRYQSTRCRTDPAAVRNVAMGERQARRYPTPAAPMLFQDIFSFSLVRQDTECFRFHLATHCS